MLTGTSEAAERAVADALATSECGVSADELLMATVNCAIQLRDECLPRVEIPSTLPPELKRVFLLSSTGRKCFVLRMLVGFSPEMSSEILKLQRDDFDELLCRALKDLPRLPGAEPSEF